MEISSPSTWNDWWNPENNGWPEHFCSTCTIYTYIWYYMCIYIYIIYIAHIHIILSPNLYVIFIEKSNHPCGFQEFTVVIWKKWDSNGNPSESNPWRPRWFEFLFSTRCPSHSHHMFPFARLHGFKNPPFIHLSIQFSSVLTWLVSFIETTSETMSIPVFFPMVFPWRLTGHLCGFGVSLPRFLGSLALLVAAAELRNVAVVVSLGSIGIQGHRGSVVVKTAKKGWGKCSKPPKKGGRNLRKAETLFEFYDSIDLSMDRNWLYQTEVCSLISPELVFGNQIGIQWTKFQRWKEGMYRTMKMEIMINLGH